MLSLILGLSGVRIFSLLCPYLFLPTVPPKGAESEEETPETLQKNSNKKGKAKKSKKVQKTPSEPGGTPRGGRRAALPFRAGQEVCSAPQ